MWKRQVACNMDRVLAMSKPSNQTVPYPGRYPIISICFDPTLKWLVIYLSNFLIFFSSFWFYMTSTVDWIYNNIHILIDSICTWWSINSTPLLRSSYMTPHMLTCISPSYFASSLVVAFIPLADAVLASPPRRLDHFGKSLPMCPVSPHVYQVRSL